jgi:hypothetical protein
MNRRALHARYVCRGDNPLPQFVFEKWADATPVEQFKAIHCLLYQCSEGNVPNSPVYDELNRVANELAQRIVQDLPEIRKGLLGRLSPAHASSAAVEEAAGVRSNPAPDRRTLMGQYHHPVCIEAEEGLSPHDMDCGLKEGEQGFSRPGTVNAMVALVCARGGDMPADCSQSPVIGR